MDGMLNIALPKGRLGEKVYRMFATAGYECPSILEDTRKLIFENPEKKVRYFWVKPSDVAVYVERGAADIGIAGKDILLEYEPDVYELLDLKMGVCRMAVAGKANFHDDNRHTLRVATNARNAVQQACKKNAAGILNTYQLDLDTLCVKAPHQQVLEGFESYDIAFSSDTMDEYVSLCSQKALNSLVFLNASFVSK